jgi:glutamate racemase
MQLQQGKIGVFDSGFGGLTILKNIVQQLPQYSYMYLGDNARSPYGTRSFETVYQYTWQAIDWFFNQGCNLVIIACNTASAKALRNIQQRNLLLTHPTKRVLGVLRPTTEIIGSFTKTNHIGILATNGTVLSNSYVIEVEKFFPQIKVHQQPCPMWVPLIENNEHLSEGANYFVQQYCNQLIAQNNNIDSVLLACTHYPLLQQKIKKYLPENINIISQGEIVANSLQLYLQRHTALEALCTKESSIEFFTTDSSEDFNAKASIFWGSKVQSTAINLT